MPPVDLFARNPRCAAGPRHLPILPAQSRAAAVLPSDRQTPTRRHRLAVPRFRRRSALPEGQQKKAATRLRNLLVRRRLVHERTAGGQHGHGRHRTDSSDPDANKRCLRWQDTSLRCFRCLQATGDRRRPSGRGNTARLFLYDTVCSMQAEAPGAKGNLARERVIWEHQHQPPGLVHREVPGLHLSGLPGEATQANQHTRQAAQRLPAEWRRHDAQLPSSLAGRAHAMQFEAREPTSGEVDS